MQMYYHNNNLNLKPFSSSSHAEWSLFVLAVITLSKQLYQQRIAALYRAALYILSYNMQQFLSRINGSFFVEPLAVLGSEWQSVEIINTRLNLQEISSYLTIIPSEFTIISNYVYNIQQFLRNE